MKQSMTPSSTTLPHALPISIALLTIAGLLRLQPHLANMTPFFAVSVLVGFLMGRDRAWLAGVLSASAMLLGDFVIGVHWTMAFVYAGLACAALIGAYAQDFTVKAGWLGRILRASITAGLASTVFFVVSNVGVWLVGELYPRTVEGFVTCFTMALPFFTRSLATDMFFGTAFILVASWVMMNQTQAVPNAKVSHGR